MKASEILRKLADFIDSAEGGQEQAQTVPPQNIPAQPQRAELVAIEVPNTLLPLTSTVK